MPSTTGAAYAPEELTVPPPASCTDQVTAVDCNAVVPVTVAVNVSAPPGATDAGLGEIETAITGVGVTVTVAVPVFEVSATLVATTWYVPATAGAVYTPVALTVPPRSSCTDQVTDVDWPATVPVTDAWKLIVPRIAVDGAEGLTVTAIEGGGGVPWPTAKLAFGPSCQTPLPSW